jgi:DNA-binding NarL/FixJ family response regulator
MKVLVVDDHPLILSALRSVIQGLREGIDVRGAETAEAARAMLAADPDLDLVLLDLALGDDDGFAVLAEFRSTYPALPVVVVSASERASDVIRAIDLGAMGYIPKRSSTAALEEALAMVMSGGLYIPPSMLGLVAFGGTQPLPPEDDDPRRGPAFGGLAQPAPHQQAVAIEKIGLTPRQTDVLALLLKGLPNKLIARELNLSVETVKDHVAAVLRALNVSSRTQAVLAVSQMTLGQGLPVRRTGGGL